MNTNYKKEYSFDPSEREKLDQDTHMSIEICSTEAESWLEVDNCTFSDVEGGGITNSLIDEATRRFDITVKDLMDEVSNYYPEIEVIRIGLDYFFYVDDEDKFNDAIFDFLADDNVNIVELYEKVNDYDLIEEDELLKEYSSKKEAIKHLVQTGIKKNIF